MNGLDKHPIDDLFRERLEGAGVAPSARSWDRIQSELGRQRRKKAIIWWQAAAAAALLIIAFSAGYLLSGEGGMGPQLTHESGSGLPAGEQAKADVKDQALQESSSPTMSQPTEAAGERSLAVAKPIIRQSHPSSFASSTPVQRAGQGVQTQLASESRPIVQADAEEGFFISALTALAASIPDDQGNPIVIRFRTEHLNAILDPFWQKAGDEEVSENEPEWRIGGNLSPLMAFAGSNSNADATQELTNNNLQSVSTSGTERPQMTFSAGLNTSMQLHPRVALSTGLSFTRLGQEKENASLAQDISSYWGPLGSFSAVTSAGEIVLSSQQAASLDNGTILLGSGAAETSSIIQQFEYLEIPLIMETSLIDQRIRLSFDAGLSAGLLIGNRAYVIDQGERLSVGGTQGLRPLLWNGLAAFGLSIPISTGWEISLRPGMRYAFTPINKNNDFTYQPWSVSFGTGLTYRLR